MQKALTEKQKPAVRVVQGRDRARAGGAAPLCGHGSELRGRRVAPGDRDAAGIRAHARGTAARAVQVPQGGRPVQGLTGFAVAGPDLPGRCAPEVERHGAQQEPGRAQGAVDVQVRRLGSKRDGRPRSNLQRGVSVLPRSPAVRRARRAARRACRGCSRCRAGTRGRRGTRRQAAAPSRTDRCRRSRCGRARRFVLSAAAASAGACTASVPAAQSSVTTFPSNASSATTPSSFGSSGGKQPADIEDGHRLEPAPPGPGRERQRFASLKLHRPRRSSGGPRPARTARSRSGVPRPA